MFPWLQQTFVGDEVCVTSPKSVCVGGYIGAHTGVVVSPDYSSIIVGRIKNSVI